MAGNEQWREWGRRALDLLYPRECLATGEPVEPDSPCRFLSHAGLERIYFIREPHCSSCGTPFFGELLGLRDCPHCRELNPEFERGRSLFVLRDAGRELIHELKYNNGRHLLPDIETLARRQPEFIAFLQDGLLAPIPLHPLRERERGYNQSRLIADQLSRAAETPVVEILERVKFTETQTRLNRAQRQTNMRAAFALKPNADLDPDRRYILVDDVFTTGSTLNSAAKALRKAGAERIDVVTLGHG